VTTRASSSGSSSAAKARPLRGKRSSAGCPTTKISTGAGSDFSKEEFAGVTSLDKQAWLNELEGVKDWFGKMGDKLPAKLGDIRDEFEKEFQAA
jgi:GTP-dependent phosphoenolpyruvate carboxykinase